MVTYSDYVMEHVTIWEGILYAVFARYEGTKMHVGTVTYDLSSITP